MNTKGDEIIIGHDVLVLALQIQRWKDEGQTNDQIAKELNKCCNLGWLTETSRCTAYKLLENCDISQIKSMCDSFDNIAKSTGISEKWSATIEVVKNISSSAECSV